MHKLQVLITSMHQKDLSLIDTMNLNSDTLIANQANTYAYLKAEKDEKTFEMVTTATIGASRNRNIAICCSSQNATLILFSDDDLVMRDGYEELIYREFDAHPEADAIVFNIANNGPRAVVTHQTYKKASMRTLASGGVWGLVIKRSVLLEKNLRFNESFGPGTKKYCGEDTIFLQDLLKKHIRVYHSPVYIADICHDLEDSCWFEGYNERYFTVGGMVLAHIYPLLAWLIVIRSAYRFSKRDACDLPFSKILKCYWTGILEETKRS